MGGSQSRWMVLGPYEKEGIGGATGTGPQVDTWRDAPTPSGRHGEGQEGIPPEGFFSA